MNPFTKMERDDQEISTHETENEVCVLVEFWGSGENHADDAQ